MSDDFTEVDVFEAAKRCGIRRASWIGDWFTSWSPRNDNCNAEGNWAHWVNLAKFILSHPATEVVDKEAYNPTLAVDRSMHTDCVTLSDEQLAKWFPAEEGDTP